MEHPDALLKGTPDDLILAAAATILTEMAAGLLTREAPMPDEMEAAAWCTATVGVLTQAMKKCAALQD
jgi:hypothetical protein